MKRSQTLKKHRFFSSHQLRHIIQSKAKRLDKALRILDVLTPKTRAASARHNHLRLVRDLLRTDSDQIIERQLSEDFVVTKVGSNVFEEILESGALNNGDSSSVCSRFDASVLSNGVSLCGSTRDLRGGIQYHCLALSTGFVDNVYVGSSLISFYGKCGALGDAYKVFEEMPVRNVVSWTAIISGFAQEWQVDVCLELYSVMRNSTLKPNDITLTSLLSACTGSGALGQGRSAHCQVILMGFDSYLHIANALISMYCKCGSVECALYIFENLGVKDIISWNSMIAGHAQHGMALQAIELFVKMKKQGVKPDAITFLGVLSSCRHVGFVEEGKNYFNSMFECGVRPELDHYSCLVDLLGRAGKLEEARYLVKKMPLPPNAVIWGSLLSSCRLHGNIWIGIQAAESRLLLEPECATTHVQLANLYASVRRWDQAARVRKLMKDRRLKTNPGYSWIEIKNEVFRFRAEDISNSQLGDILNVLDCLIDHMTTLGHVYDLHMEMIDDTTL